MKKCPFCTKEIQDSAIKCRYCQKWLDNDHELKSKSVGMIADKTLRNIIIAGIIIVVPSVVYYCVYLPLKKEYGIKKCSQEAVMPLTRTLEDIANKTSGKARLDESVFNKCLGDKGLMR